MQILMLAPEPYFEPRGTPISIRDRLFGLSKLGHQVDLLTYHLGEDIVIPGVYIYRIPRVPFVKKIKIGPSWPKLFLDGLLLIKAVQLLRKKTYQVIHSHEETAFMAVILAKLFEVKHLYDMHSSLPKQFAKSRYGRLPMVERTFQWLEKVALKSCDALITVAPDLYDHAEKINPSINQILIENCAWNFGQDKVNPGEITRLEARLNISERLPVVYVGNLMEYQGVEILIESAAMVKVQYPDVVFVIVGGHPEQIAKLAAKVHEHQLNNYFVFPGAVPPQEAQIYMALAKILVSPRTEGTTTPLKIYHYMNAGNPILATRSTAHTLVLNENVACLVDSHPKDFAEGMIKLLSDPELRDRLAQNALDHLHKYHGFENYVAKLEEIYTTLESDP
jgi:glycosyltransferase involved in cell wall biosynthesis